MKAEDILHQQRLDKEYLPITVRRLPPFPLGLSADPSPFLGCK